jgi:type IV pilus assembly protein PilB
MRNCSTDELREAAQRAGMVSLREAGMKACFEGITSAEEVIRETILEG